MDPFLEVELGYLAEQLTTAQSKVRDASKRLAGVEEGGDTRLAGDLAVVQERIQTSAEGVEALLESLPSHDTRRAISPETSVALQSSKETATIGRSLDVASRQLRGLLQQTINPLAAGELGSLAEQLAATVGRVKDISERLAAIGESRGTGLENDLAVVQERVRKSATDLWGALPNLPGSHQLLSVLPESNGTSAAYGNTRSVAVSLDIASRQLQSLTQGSIDLVLQAELSSIRERVV